MAEKRKKPVISEEERAAQRARRQEESQRANEAIGKRIAKLQALPGMNVLTGSLSISVPIHASFVSSQDALLYVRGGALIARIRKGDLIQLNCGAAPRAGIPCVAVYQERWIFALPKDESGRDCFNLSSRRPEDDNIRLGEDQFIGNIAYVVPDPSAGAEQAGRGKESDPCTSLAEPSGNPKSNPKAQP